MDICPYCNEPVDEDLDDYVEAPQGIAHDICYAEHLDAIHDAGFAEAAAMMKAGTFKLNLPQD